MPIESVGEQVNLPPYTLPNFVQPPPSQLIEFDPQEDNTIEFNSGPIGDPNPNDRLSWRWFLDYREATFNRPIELSEASGASPDELIDGISKTIRPCAEPTFSLLSDDTLHRVELVVADRPFITSEPDDPRPNQTLPADAQFFRLVWYVRLDRSLCP
ncbi:MAG: hypothetical protein VX589_02155 [Myxococcota bacterium]|nr:hypothetical protein [Myxococcota bacterium]